MAKKRKLSGDTPSYVPRHKPSLPTPEEQARTKAFNDELNNLYGYFLSHGCPCRFPRFRALVSLDTRDVGIPNCTTREQQSLVLRFEDHISLRDTKKDYMGYEGTCPHCGAHVKQWTEMVFRDSAINYLKITPAPGATDVGAPLHTAVPRCSDFYSAEPVDYQHNPLHVVHLQFPKVSPEHWLAWIRELRENEPASSA